MTINQNLTEFAGLPVVDFPAEGLDEYSLPRGDSGLTHEEHRDRWIEAAKDPAAWAWRLRVESYEPEEEFGPCFLRFLEAVDTTPITALVVGMTGSVEDEPGYLEARDLLIRHRDAFPNLRSIFLGDVTFEESEVSWLNHTDVAPLLAAYPELDTLVTRGTGDSQYRASDEEPTEDTVLRLHVPRHEGLRRLIVESGGLRGRTCRELCSSDLPRLEHLELWLGVDTYGYDAVPEDLAPLLSGEAFPGLRHLGLRNAEDTDDWVRVLASAPILARLETLDLSLGTLREEGARILMETPAFHALRRIDLHHHYLPEETRDRLREALTASGVEVDLSEEREPSHFSGEDLYYPAVGE